MKSIKSVIIACILILIFYQPVTAQDETASPHALFASLGTGNNMVYMGSSISGDKPYYYGSLIYGFREKLYASATTFHLASFDQFLAFSTFALTYSQTFNSWFDLSAGISRYQVNSELADTLFSNFFYGDITLGFDWKILYTKISSGGVFAESSGFYLQVRNSRYFETPGFLNEKAYISFDPYINTLFGTLTETVTSDGTTIGITKPYSPKKTSGRNSTGSTVREFFSLMEVDFGVPVSFNMGRITLELDPGYILPLYSDTDPLNPKGLSVLLSCYVKIL